ncbi:MAG: MarR family transcriptional regulator [Clostridia bacterium]|nr:MarR family transcriptional regulator [Clostridia bacterium]
MSMKEQEKIEPCMVHQDAGDINDKMIIHLRDLGHIMHFLYEGKGSQKRILIILQEVGCITQRDLTIRLGIQPGSVSEVLAKLEHAGYIERTASCIDRRTTNIQLTAAGRVLAEEATVQRRKRHQEMFSCLSDDEKQTFLALMEKVCTDWKNRYPKKSEGS